MKTLGFTNLFIEKINNHQIKPYEKKTLTILKGKDKIEYESFKIDEKISGNNRNFFYITEHVFLRNSYNNIISNQTTSTFYKKHIFDSSSIVPLIISFSNNKFPQKFMDFGTGGGFPGLVLLTYFPRVFVLFLDSIEKKNHFHEGMFRILESKNSNSISSRGEQLVLSKMHKETYHIITSRAVADLGELLKIFFKFSKDNGKLIAMKKIKGCGHEFNNAKSELSSGKIKIKCLVKIDKKKQGKSVFLFKKF